MNTELLSILNEIKLLLIVILIIVSILLLGQLARFTSKLIHNRVIYRERAFVSLASRHFDNKEYKELSEYCEEKIKKWNNNSAYPLYWLARAKYMQGDLISAKELFEKVKEMEPEWESTVDPHIRKINLRQL